MMDTVLFTDHGIVVFVALMSAIALVLAVLGLATTHQMRSEIEHQFEGGNSTAKDMSDDRGVSEWNLVKRQFQARLCVSTPTTLKTFWMLSFLVGSAN